MSSLTSSAGPSAIRTSFSAASQVSAFSAVSSIRPPESGRVSSTSAAAASLASISSGSCNERRPAARSGSSVVKSGSSRASTRSSGRVDGPVRIPVSTASSSAGLSSDRPASICRPPPPSPPRTAAPWGWGVPPSRVFPPRPVFFQPFNAFCRSLFLHRRPEPGGVQLRDVRLDLVLVPGRHRSLSLVVYVEHQGGGLGLRVAEQLLEHVRDVRHQVDGVVPHDRLPGDVGRRVLGEVRLDL